MLRGSPPHALLRTLYQRGIAPGTLAERIDCYIAVDRAESRHRIFRQVLIGAGLSTLLLFGAPLWLAPFFAVYIAVDLAFGYHNRLRSRPNAPRTWRVLRLLQAHQAVVLLLYSTIPIFLSFSDSVTILMVAGLMIFAQCINVIGLDTRSRDRAAVAVVSVAVIAQLVVYGIGSHVGISEAEQILLHVIGLLVSIFFLTVARSCVDLHHSLQTRTQQLATAQKGEAMGQLASGVAHDFNNLLTVMRGNLDLLKEVPAEEESRLLNEVRAATDRGSDLVAQLMDRTTPAVGQRQDVALPAFLDSFSTFAKRVLPSNVRLHVVAGAPLTVRLDPAQFEAALLNLVINARDAMPDGGTIQIQAQTDRRGGADGAVISVRDTGRGMEADFIAQAARPYVTTKGKGTGTGLGLAMVKTFAEEDGGALSIQSAPGAGTTVRIWLPL
ncbi:MAG: ATP-binding protein [Pseudomonadota bacterium]